MMTPPPDFEAAVAAQLGLTNYVAGSLDITFVNGGGPTTVRMTVSYTIDSTVLLTEFTNYLNSLSSTTTTTTTSTTTTTETTSTGTATT